MGAGPQKSMAESKRKVRSVKKSTESEQRKPSGVGAYLREERRNRSVDLQKIARTTRLRLQTLQAIEREEWDELPAPVFVMGFIRAYARALGLDERYALELYKADQPFTPDVPKPLMKPERTGRGMRILLLLLLGLVGGILLYLWQGNSAPEWPQETREGVLTEPAPPAQPSIGSDAVETPEERAPDTGGGAGPEGRSGEESHSLAEGPDASRPEASTGVTREASAGMVSGVTAYESPREPPGETSEEPSQVSDDGVSLDMEVSERTWTKISIDGGEPREFMFQPGSQPHWEGREKIDLLIGNAGGVIIRFEGQTYDDLGKKGEVLRLVFPEDAAGLKRGEN